MNAGRQRVAVVGAGIVGISSALWLQRFRFDVTLIDRAGPGTGASLGNAGVLAPHAFMPVNNPSIPSNVARLLFASGSPLSFDWTYAARMAPWLVSFLRNCDAPRVNHIAHAMHALVSRNLEFFMPLLQESGALELMHDAGSLTLYETEADWRAASMQLSLVREFGIEAVEMEPGGIREMEPNLAPVFARAQFFPRAMQYHGSPLKVCEALAAHFTAAGGRLLIRDIAKIAKSRNGGLVLTDAAGSEIEAEQVVLAGGAHSKTLFGGLLERFPLETERGYHVMFAGQGNLLHRSVSIGKAGVAITPMRDGLRCAGMVEFAGLAKPANPACYRYLTASARRFLPDLQGETSAIWLGFRPSMPDAMPVIGRSRRTPAIILAFGHQHVGMSSAGVTGRLVAAIARNEPGPVDLAPFSPGRFLRRQP